MENLNALNIAKYIYNKGYVGNLQLNKLLYISFGFYGALDNKYLFDDRIEAWKYGPVIPTVYYALKKHEYLFSENRNIVLSKDEKESIDTVLSIYGDKAPFLLVEVTHKENTPWKKSYIPGVSNIEIDKNAINEYYRNLRNISDKVVENITSDDFMKVMKDLSET